MDDCTDLSLNMLCKSIKLNLQNSFKSRDYIQIEEHTSTFRLFEVHPLISERTFNKMSYMIHFLIDDWTKSILSIKSCIKKSSIIQSISSVVKLITSVSKLCETEIGNGL